MEHIYLVKHPDPLSPDCLRFLLELIQPERRSRIRKQQNRQHADAMLLGELLAKVAVFCTFGIEIRDQVFLEGIHGKPYLNNHPEVFFNISHSGDWVVCAVSDRRIGVDIQKITPCSPTVMSFACSEKELLRLRHCPEPNSAFIQLWTKKEALLKRDGTGIAYGDLKACLRNENVRSWIWDRVYWISVSS